MKTWRIRHLLVALLSVVILAGSAAALSASKPLPIAEKKPPVSTEHLRDAQYVGAKTCRGCHRETYSQWSQTWHANMHREISPEIVVADFNNREITYQNIELATNQGDKVRISPTIRVFREGDRFFMSLLDKDDPANNQTHEIAYVLGGNWNQHFEARVGDMYFATPMRWEVADKAWFTRQFNTFWWVADGTPDGRPKRPAEMPLNQVGDAKCDSCHTTGFKTAKDQAMGRWIARKSELGISCEVCHGPGSIHVKTRDKGNIVNPSRLNALQQDQLCGQCHSRVTSSQEKDLAFPQGFFIGNTDLQDRVRFWDFTSNPDNFWPNGDAKKNRQQYHDIQKGAHQQQGVTCITCHDVHSSKKGVGQIRVSRDELCASCHISSQKMYDGSVMAKAGASCVDCHMARIANRSGATKVAKEHWDVSAHTMKPVLPQYAVDNKMKSSCDTCHQDADRVKRGTDISRYQGDVRARIDALNAALQRYEKKDDKALNAAALRDEVLRDGSMGAHNYQKAVGLLDAALKSLER